jgi:hypothetical protein
LPGTPGKLAVLAARAQRGEPLFHPGDARFGGCWELVVQDCGNGYLAPVGQRHAETGELVTA